METIIEEYLKFIQIEKGLRKYDWRLSQRFEKYQLYMQEQKLLILVL